MASSPESADCGCDSSASSSPRNDLVVKLIKLEDQLGLTRWTTLAEVKQEPVDDDDDDDEDDDMAQTDDCGMEWIPVKVEDVCAEEEEEEESRPHDTLTKDAGCLDRSATEVGRAVHNGINDSLTTLRDQSAELHPQSPVTCVAVTALVNGAEASSPSSSQAPMDNTMSSLAESAGDCAVVTSSEVCPVDSTTTTLTPLLDQDSPPCQVNSAVVSHSPSPSCPATTITTTATSPQITRLESLSVSSSRVEFLDGQNGAGDDPVMEENPFNLTMVEGTMDVDIASSELTVLDDQMVRGLEAVVAATTSSPSFSKLASKRAIRHAHRKQKTSKKSPKGGDAKEAHATEKKMLRKQRGRTAKADGNQFVNVVDSVDTTVNSVSRPKDFKADCRSRQNKPECRSRQSKSECRSRENKSESGSMHKRSESKSMQKRSESKSMQKRSESRSVQKRSESRSTQRRSESQARSMQKRSERSESMLKQNKLESMFKPSKPKSRPKGRSRSVSESKDTEMFPIHPTAGRRVQSGTVSAFNLFRLSQLLPSEEAAVEFGQLYKLLPRFRFCPSCGQRLDKMYRIMRQGKRPLFRFQCNKQPCKQSKNQVPLRWGTKFMSSNISVRKAIVLDYCFIKKYDIPTAKSESAIPEFEDSDRMLSTSTETVVDYYNNCREICAYSIMSCPPIGGLGYTVELFQSFFVGSKSHNEGGSKSHKVHAFQGQYILAGICIENNDVLFAVAPDLEPGNVLPLLQSKVALGTHIRTSSCEAYKHLKQFGYEHTTVKESQLFVHSDLSFSGCSNTSQAGTMRPLAFHRRSGTFNLHLAEYLWRRKHREASDIFLTYLESVAAVYPLKVSLEDDQAEDD